METAAQQPSRFTITAGVVLLLVLLFSFSFSASAPVLHLVGLSKINGTVLFISRLLYWFCLLLTWLYASNIEKQPLLLWQEKKYNFLTYFLSFIAIAAIISIGGVIIEHLEVAITKHKEQSHKLAEMVAIFRDNKFLLVFTALTAGVTEELLFRGYLLPRMEILFKNAYVAIFISSLLFGLMHFRYGTIVNMAGPFFIGLVFAIYYWKYRNIKLLIVSHFLWDVMGLFVLLKQLK